MQKESLDVTTEAMQHGGMNFVEKGSNDPLRELHVDQLAPEGLRLALEEADLGHVGNLGEEGEGLVSRGIQGS